MGLILALPAAADAATLDAGKSCYFNDEPARLGGGGFAPDSPITFTRNGRRISETVSRTPRATSWSGTTRRAPSTERKLVIRATDAKASPQDHDLRHRKRRVTADPDSASNVRTWKAVLKLFGFGTGKAFIHYLNPNGNLKKTVKLGRLRGPCGRIKTGERRVMPFDNPEFGVWRLQFDTHRRYDRDRKNKAVIPVNVFRG